MRGWVHALVISVHVWMAIICSITGRWPLSLIWLVTLAAYVVIISVDTKRQR